MQQITFGKKNLKTDRPAFVMGIVNATPDSFFSGSRGGIERALQLIEEGADVIDIGGESTRPGYTPVPADEEIKRILPVLNEIRKTSDIAVSIDTTKLEVFKAAFENGADVWNDVCALSGKTENAEYVARTGAGVILMHNGPGDILEVNKYLEEQVQFCLKNGIALDKIIVDPGIGFGKSNEQSISLIKNTGLLCDGKYPVLMALSRKRCIGEMTGKPTEERMAGTLAADLLSVQKGAVMVRVHDVSETIDGLNVMKYL